jgi:Tfp pilus assembly protein PilF
VKEEERAFNSIGVALMMQGRFEDAMPWFEKAMKNGCQAAEKNIEAINAEYEYEAQQQKIIDEYLKKYE